MLFPSSAIPLRISHAMTVCWLSSKEPLQHERDLPLFYVLFGFGGGGGIGCWEWMNGEQLQHERDLCLSTCFFLSFGVWGWIGGWGWMDRMRCFYEAHRYGCYAPALQFL